MNSKSESDMDMGVILHTIYVKCNQILGSNDGTWHILKSLCKELNISIGEFNNRCSPP